jgi:PBP4 family serine-type D-alanyl-D-alanine carboxypeptidase
VRKLFLILCLSAIPLAAADQYNFSLLPSNGIVSGAAGSTVGWGYSIQNQSSTLWLVTTGLNSDFLNATPNWLFDSPDVAPGATVPDPFDLANSAGLFEITWDQSAPGGFVNAGTFDRSAEWWTGNPLNGGSFASAVATTSQPYSAPGTPEPTAFGLVSLVLLGFLACRLLCRPRAKQHCIALLFSLSVVGFGANGSSGSGGDLPRAIRAIMEKPRYDGATWALRVVDVKSGKVMYNLNSRELLLTGSVRKLYSIGVTLNKLGADYRFKTPVFRNGEVDASGNLKGDLILVAKGDLTMGGRDNGDDTIAITNFDHNDANGLGSAILTKPNPLAGLDKLAAQIAASGIKRVSGDVIIDDRLFEPFRVPNQELLITPIIINDNRIDVTILPTQPGEQARVEWRPHTATFKVIGHVITVAAGDKTDVKLKQTGLHTGVVSGQIAADYTSSLPGVKTLVQTFRIDDPAYDPAAMQEPAAFARTTFIEALERAGITVRARLVGPNPSRKLPPPDSYWADGKVAELISAPYAQYSKLILKISHNLGANLSLMLFGLDHGVNTMPMALNEERATLIDRYGLDGYGFYFPTNGSGSPDSRASAATTVDLLISMKRRKTFPLYFDSLPILGVDGSLAEIGTDSPARGKVFAKTGTFLDEDKIKAQTLAGYIDACSGRRLAYALFVNDAGEITDISEVIDVIQDEGAISTIIQQLN